MEVYRRSSWQTLILLGLLIFSTALHGVQGEIESDGPSESECRPHIEKALKQLEAGETEATPTVDQGDSKEDIPTVEITTDDSVLSEDNNDNPPFTESSEIELNPIEESEEEDEVDDDDTDNNINDIDTNNDVSNESEETVTSGEKWHTEYIDLPEHQLPESSENVDNDLDQEQNDEPVSNEIDSIIEEPAPIEIDSIVEEEPAQIEIDNAVEEADLEKEEEYVINEDENVDNLDDHQTEEEIFNTLEVESNSKEVEETNAVEDEIAENEVTDDNNEEETDTSGNVEDLSSAETENVEENLEAEEEVFLSNVEHIEEAELIEEISSEQVDEIQPLDEDIQIINESETSSENIEEAETKESSEGTEDEKLTEGFEAIETNEIIEPEIEVEEKVKEETEEVEEQEEEKTTEEIVEEETTEEIETETETQEEVEEVVKEIQKDESVVEELIKESEAEEIELRPRDHVAQLLKLDSESEEFDKVSEKTSEIVLRDLKKLYENAIKPLESLYKYRDLSNRHFGDSEIFSKPLILFMGPWSGGKSSIINYLLGVEQDEINLHTGAEPSPAYFNILMYGDEPEILDGTELAADYTFSGLQKFGQGLEERLKGYKFPSKLLEKVNIVEIPGILEVRKQVSRIFPFNDACQWFIDRADIIFLVYDPSKLDVGPETEAILDQLKGREHQTRIVLNKADQVKPEELMRVQGALIWNISPLMSSAQPPIMYTTSLWSQPYEQWAPVRLLQAQERAFLRDLRSAIDKRIDNKIASARRFAVRVRNHAKMVDCYLTTYYNHKSVFGNRKQVSDEIINHPQDYHIYEGLSTLTNISRYDLPDPDVYRDFFRLNALYDFQQLSSTCTYFRGCPINRLDIAIAYDLPELVGKHKRLIESAFSENVASKTPGS